MKLKLARIFAPTQKIVWRDKLIKLQYLWNCGKTRVLWKCEGGITQSETEPLQNWSTLVEILLFCLPKFWAWTAGKFRKCTLFPLKYNQFVLENDHATFFRGTMQDPQHCFGRQTLSDKLLRSFWTWEMKFISAQFRQVSRQEASHHRLSHIVISSPHPLLSFSPMVFASCIIYCKICSNLSWIFSGVYRYQEVLNGYIKIISYHNIPKRGLRNLNSHKFDFFCHRTTPARARPNIWKVLKRGWKTVKKSASLFCKWW